MSVVKHQDSSPLRSHPVPVAEDNRAVTRSRTRSNVPRSNSTERKGVDITFGMFTLSPGKHADHSHRQPRASNSINGHVASKDSSSILLLRQELGFDVLERIEATGEAVDDGFLLKWLHARGPEIVADSIRHHAAWREAFVGRNRLGIMENTISEELAAQKIFLQGLDHHGCSVLLFLISRHRSGIAPAETTNRLLTYAIDNACTAADLQLNRERKVCCIFDLSGVKIGKNVDINFLRGVFDILQTHFPETLSRLYFIDAPLLFLGVWKCVMPFIQPATKSKIVFVSGANGRQQLSDAIGPSILPPSLSGTGQFLPVDEAVSMLRQGKGIPRAAGETSPVEEDEGQYARQQQQGQVHKFIQLIFLGNSYDTTNGKKHIFARLVLVFLFFSQLLFLFNKALSLALPG